MLDRRLPAGQRVDLVFSGETALRLLRKCEAAVDGNLEHPTPGFDELHLGTIPVDQIIPHTEGARAIASSHAIFDGNIHFSNLSYPCIIQVSPMTVNRRQPVG